MTDTVEFKKKQLKFNKMLDEARAQGVKTNNLLSNAEKNIGAKPQMLGDYDDDDSVLPNTYTEDAENFLNTFKKKYYDIKKKHTNHIAKLRMD